MLEQFVSQPTATLPAMFVDGFIIREDLSRAEAIRRAIALLLSNEAAHPDQAFGLWKGRETEGVQYQQALRGEWDG